jgi:hypothetical protein
MVGEVEDYFFHGMHITAQKRNIEIGALNTIRFSDDQTQYIFSIPVCDDQMQDGNDICLA